MCALRHVLIFICLPLMMLTCASPSTKVLGQESLPLQVKTVAAVKPSTGATLLAHWPLAEHATNTMETTLTSTVQEVTFETVTSQGVTHRAASFNGRDSAIEIANAAALQFGTEPFSIALWLYVPETLGDSLGDLLSKFDYGTRTGFHLGVYSHGGVTNSQPNCRQLHFGIDSNQLEPEFLDHGRLGDAVYIFSLCVHAGRLYASSCSAEKNQAGRVYRFEEENRWTDLGSPDKANAISAMTTFKGQLYVASSKYRLAGSSLAESENPHLGGSVFRLTDDSQWEYCGRLAPETEAVASLIEYRGELFASSLYRPAGFFKYLGGQEWQPYATPQGKRVEAMTRFNDAIYATCYDDGLVFRFDGKSWETVGKIPGATQTYGFGVYRGQLYVSEWPQAHVFRYQGGSHWEDAGKLGQELEAMPLLIYNGKMYGGTLPLAEVYRYDDQQNWTKIGRVDATANVKYRRAWSMAVYQGRMYVGTLPGGRVLSIEAGKNATYDQELTPGWRHIAAIRDTDRLALYVDGQQVATSAPFDTAQFNLNNQSPSYIGFGAQDHLDGRIRDLRIYRGALSAEEIGRLAESAERSETGND